MNLACMRGNSYLSPAKPERRGDGFYRRCGNYSEVIGEVSTSEYFSTSTRSYNLLIDWENISRRASPAAERLASHISTYSRDNTTPSAPAPNAA